MHIDELQYDVKGWASNSGAFLQLSKMTGVKFSCGATASIPVLFTAPLGSRLELSCQARRPSGLSTGAVLSGAMSHWTSS